MTTNPPAPSEPLLKAIAALNTCCQSVDAAGVVTFKPDAKAAGEAEPIIRNGLSEAGMSCGPRGFLRLHPNAVARLAPLGLDISKAYDINEAKWRR